ncbi:hypothetical protein FHX81_5702 [Saccharothrix saharensis]|uniref:Uncharacterized protein n=1 Tax=Saccharothrix saharensis TaxID=571190 RepID=A0A543JKH6_9PSEU|nr:hypothetical protein [Saccharothrix saharensis]TQM83284.1 hypothetical protein FHX81_5702 [Saccharothrix saharensis]
MNQRVVAAGAQLALVVVGVPVVYLIAFPVGLTARSLLPPVGLLAGLVVGGVLVGRARRPAVGPLAGWAVFLAALVLALVSG